MSETDGRPRDGQADKRFARWRRSPPLRRGGFVAAVLLICFLWAMPMAGLAFALVERGVEHWWLILVFGLLMPVAAAFAVRGVLAVFRRIDGERGEVGPGSAALPAPTRRAAAVSAVAAPLPSSIEPLSRREVEVLEQLAAGLSNREIAGALHVAPGTVKAHLNHIFRKLEATSRLQAVAHARRAGLLDAREQK